MQVYLIVCIARGSFSGLSYYIGFILKINISKFSEKERQITEILDTMMAEANEKITGIKKGRASKKYSYF